MKKYIHYGSNEFNKEMIYDSFGKRAYDDNYGKKPLGLWASPVDAKIGWREWCLDQEFRTERLKESFKFVVDEKAKILRIEKEEDILPFVIILKERENPNNIDSLYLRRPVKGCKTCRFYDMLDLNKLYNRFDGMEYISGDWRLSFGIFNSWDVDSIVIWNPDVILPIKS